ncbi:helix-turn-helix domain-containing protein [Flagellimonas sp.]|uniref:helix-turn-helix domain-containing protein n=1 Tax=Flagellimonas sp. TaxID=2058762 RepID=UPI003B5073D6
MNELLWIKSLLHFLILCLSGLVLGILFNQKEKITTKVWMPAIGMILMINLWGLLWSVLRFTSWGIVHSEFVHYFYPLYIFFNFLLGPVLFLSLKNEPLFFKMWPHAVPALTCLLWLWGELGNELLLTIFAFLHFMAYAIYILWKLENRIFSRFGWSVIMTILWLWSISYLVHILELILWAQLDFISETMAWVFYVLSQTILGFSLLYLVYSLASKKSKFGMRDQSDLPKEILEKLQREFLNYITDPQVFMDPLISQQRVAKDLKVSSYHVSRYLNHHHGDTFLNIINGLRIKTTLELIENPENHEKTIKDIFYQVGFNSRSTFNSAFKNYTGLTPSKYRSKFKD